MLQLLTGPPSVMSRRQLGSCISAPESSLGWRGRPGGVRARAGPVTQGECAVKSCRRNVEHPDGGGTHREERTEAKRKGPGRKEDCVESWKWTGRGAQGGEEVRAPNPQGVKQDGEPGLLCGTERPLVLPLGTISVN